jgi:BirA family biotin operon repressor/biotin-[acetyl-CoA-carboxylase] ligase
LAAELAKHGAAHAQLPTAMAAHPVAALEQIWTPAELTALLAHCLNALDAALTRFAQAGFAPFREQWIAEHAYGGRSVVLFENGRQIASGIAESVDALGQLIIATANGICRYPAGDVSLRLGADTTLSGQHDT